MRIGLTQAKLDTHKYLMDVSKPHSPNYGKHWSPQEAVDAFNPSEDTVSVVRDWLVEVGTLLGQDYSLGQQSLVRCPCYRRGSRGPDDDRHEYEDSHTGGIMPACDEYHLPKHIQELIDYMAPSVKLLATVGNK